MGVWDETIPGSQSQAIPGTPPLVPTLGSIGSLSGEQQRVQQALNQYIQWQQQNQRNAGIAGAARPGTPGGGPTAPYSGGAIPGGPGGPIARATQPVGGQVQGLPGSAVPMTAPQVQPAMQAPYYQGGAKGGTAANAVIGVGNLLARTRQQDQQKEYTQAEGLWTQILTAQANMQKAAERGMDDQYDQHIIDTILSDKKNVKMIQDTFGTLTMDPSQQQQGQDDPTKQAQAAGAKSAVQKFGSGIGRVLSGFDPRTEAQRMKGGQQLPLPGTPGGVMWQFPQPTQEAIAERQAREAETPEERRQALAIKEKREPDADTKARMKMEEERNKALDKYRQDMLKEMRRSHDLTYKAREDAIKASAAKNNVPEARLKSLYDKFRSGDMDERSLSRLPANERKAVLDMDIPIARELNQQQRTTLSNAHTSEVLIGQMRTSLAKMKAAKPELFAPGLWANLKATGKTAGLFELYSKTGLKIDPVWTEFFASAGAAEAKGAAPFMTVARNRQMLDIALQHLPKPTDSPQQLEIKLKWLDESMVGPAINEINDYRWDGHPVPDPYMAPGQQPKADPAWEKYMDPGIGPIEGDPTPPPELSPQ